MESFRNFRNAEIPEYGNFRNFRNTGIPEYGNYGNFPYYRIIVFRELTVIRTTETHVYCGRSGKTQLESEKRRIRRKRRAESSMHRGNDHDSRTLRANRFEKHLIMGKSMHTFADGYPTRRSERADRTDRKSG